MVSKDRIDAQNDLEGGETFMSAINFLAEPSSVVGAMLYAYLDDSHTHSGTATVTMAGYIAPSRGWKRFEKSSKKLFKKDGIGVFHAKEFENRKGAFGGWTAQRQLRFATEWLDIAHANVMCGYSVPILKNDYHKARKETGLAQDISAYGYCFKILLRNACRNRALWDQICAHGLSIIIEDGNVNNAGIEADFHRILQENGPLNGRVSSRSPE